MVKFRMDNIHVSQFAILRDNPENNNYSVNTNISYRISESSQHIACVCKFDFLDEKENILFTGEVICEFLIHKDDWNKMTEHDNKIIVPKELLEFLAVHTIGTSRGIFYCKTEGSPYTSFIIPPLNIRSVITDDIEFAKEIA